MSRFQETQLIFHPHRASLSHVSRQKLAGTQKTFSPRFVDILWPGISNVVAIETTNDNSSAGTLDFVHAFYRSLAHGCTLQSSFEAAMRK